MLPEAEPKTPPSEKPPEPIKSEMPPPASAPDNPTKISPVFEFLWKEWRVIKSPSFWIATVIFVFGTYWLIDHFYSAQVNGLNAAIVAKNSQIETYRWVEGEITMLTNNYQSLDSNLKSLNLSISNDAATIQYYSGQMVLKNAQISGLSSNLESKTALIQTYSDPAYRINFLAGWAVDEFQRGHFDYSIHLLELTYFSDEHYGAMPNHYKSVLWPIYAAARLMTNGLPLTAESVAQFKKNLETDFNQFHQDKEFLVAASDNLDVIKKSARFNTPELAGAIDELKNKINFYLKNGVMP